MNDRVGRLLAELQELGWKVVLRPNEVVVDVGTLKMSGRHAPRDVKISLDEVSLERRIRSITLRMTAGALAEADIDLVVIP